MNAESSAATPAVANTESVRCPGRYVGADKLAGFESTDILAGEYWTQTGVAEGHVLFQPTGSSKIFELSDEDIKRN